MKRFKSVHDQSGFSLIEVLLALSIGSVLVLYTGDMIVRSQMQEQKSQVTSEVDRVHLINLQRSRNPRFLTEQNLVFAGVSNRQNAELCMSGKIPPGGCALFNQPDNAPSTYTDQTHSQYFRSRITSQRMCDARGCHKIKVEVRTGDSNPSDKYDIFERKSVGYIPGYAFVSNSDIDIDCGAAVMSGLNYYQMNAQCGSMSGNFQCTTGDRLMNFGEGAALMDPALCSDMAQRACTGANQYGVDATGILTNQQYCQGPASPIGSACIANWLPRTEDICSGTNFTQTDGCGNSRASVGVGNCVPTPYPSTTASGPYTPPPWATTTTLLVTTTTATPPITTTTTMPPTCASAANWVVTTEVWGPDEACNFGGGHGLAALAGQACTYGEPNRTRTGGNNAGANSFCTDYLAVCTCSGGPATTTTTTTTTLPPPPPPMGGPTCPEECPMYESPLCVSTPVSGGCSVFCSGTGTIYYLCR